jgi:hypothetical protein
MLVFTKLKIQILGTLMCFSLLSTAQVNWEVYHDEHAGFEVLSPCTFSKSIDSFHLTSGLRILTRHAGLYRGSNDTLWFDITHWEVEGEPTLLSTKETRMMLDSSIHELEVLVGNETLYRDYSTRFGHHCVLFKIKMPEREASLKHLLLRGNRRYYLLRVYARKVSENVAAVNRFLDSFRLIE